MSKPVICEYFVQDDVQAAKQRGGGLDPYPNVFILSKKYSSISDVRLSEVVKAFPLSHFNDGHEYILRFQHEINMAHGRKKKVWLDMGKGEDVSVPSVDDRIKIKALRLPKGVQPKKIAPS